MRMKTIENLDTGYQDIKITAAYEHAVASFMTKQGVKNVRCRTYDDWIKLK